MHVGVPPGAVMAFFATDSIALVCCMVRAGAMVLGWVAGSASDGHDALLLVVADHFIWLDDRPTGPLPAVVPGENGHPTDRGALTVLAAQAKGSAEVQPSADRSLLRAPPVHDFAAHLNCITIVVQSSHAYPTTYNDNYV